MKRHALPLSLKSISKKFMALNKYGRTNRMISRKKFRWFEQEEKRTKSAVIRLKKNKFVCHKIGHMRIPQLAVTLSRVHTCNRCEEEKRGTSEKYSVEWHICIRWGQSISQHFISLLLLRCYSCNSTLRSPWAYFFQILLFLIKIRWLCVLWWNRELFGKRKQQRIYCRMSHFCCEACLYEQSRTTFFHCQHTELSRCIVRGDNLRFNLINELKKQQQQHTR